MSKNDKKIATLYSCFKNGDIELWYCSCSFRNVYELRYVVISAKWFKCDLYVSDYVFAHCRDMVDLMRRGVVGGVRCSDGLLAQWLERHSYKMRVPGSIPG